jgi:DNA-binding MarR family transcriptional regulator
MKRLIGRYLSILHRQAQIYINFALKEFEITSAEYSFLMYLYHHSGASQEELSTYLYIDKSATARAIKSLEQKGYVIRLKDEGDKRYNRVFLTEKAKSIESKVKDKILGWSEMLTEGMEPEKVEFMLKGLEEMVLKIERHDIRKKMEVRGVDDK